MRHAGHDVGRIAGLRANTDGDEKASALGFVQDSPIQLWTTTPPHRGGPSAMELDVLVGRGDALAADAISAEPVSRGYLPALGDAT